MKKNIPNFITIINLILGLFAISLLFQGQYTDLIIFIFYGCLLLDFMDGFLATKKIREDERFKHLPIIALSANAMSEDRTKSLEHGMNDHIAKPIEPNILFEILDKWLKE